MNPAPAPLTLPQALHALQTTGRVRLPGSPATGTTALRVLFTILMWLVGLLAAGSIVFVLVGVFFMEVRTTVATFLGLFGVLALLTGVFFLLRYARSKQSTYASVERLPVDLDARGLTVRGVGPIPWHHFRPARYDRVMSKADSSYERRAIMRLTDAGVVGVNNQLAPHLRDRVGPLDGLIGNRYRKWIELPSVDGLSTSDTIELVNRAQAMFLAHHPGRSHP